MMAGGNGLTYSWVPPKLLLSRLDGNFNHPKAIETRRRVASTLESRTFREVCNRIVCGPFGSALVSGEHSDRGSVVLVQPTDISDDLFALEPGWRIDEATRLEKDLDLYAPGTLLFARVGQYPHCGVLPERVRAATISSSMIAAEVAPPADPYFFNAFFRCNFGSALLFAAQKITAQPTIGTEELGDTIVPYPSSAVQRAIGNKMRKAERLREMMATALASGCALLTGMLGRRLPRVGVGSDGNVTWVPPSLVESRIDCNYNNREATEARDRVLAYPTTQSLRKMSQKITCGPFGSTLTSDEHDESGEVVLVQPTDISGTFFAHTPGWRITQKILKEKGLKEYPAGVLLFARVGIYPHCGVLPTRIRCATISSSMIAVLLNKDQDPYFYSLFFKSDVGLALLYAIQKTTAQPTISTEELSTIRVPVPPPEEQAVIGAKMRESESYHNSQISYLHAARADVEALITGTLDESRLLCEGDEIEDWLKHNPTLLPNGDHD